MPTATPPLWAVHLSDGLLATPWWVGGYVVAAFLALLGLWRLRDEDIPRIALLTAAFFVASLIHVPVPAGPRTHLLLNGLIGVLLGRRAGLAILLGVGLQALLFGHGGFSTVGVNAAVMATPALLAGLLFAGLRRVPWVRHPWFRGGLVGASTFVFLLSLVYSASLLLSNPLRQSPSLDLGPANSVATQPLTLLAAGLLATAAAWLERRLEHAPEFPVGLVVGEAAVLLSVVLHGLVLLAGGQEDYHTLALITVVIHLPLAAVEGVVLGFTVGFLVRVKPEMLGWLPEEKAPCVTEAAP